MASLPSGAPGNPRGLWKAAHSQTQLWRGWELTGVQGGREQLFPGGQIYTCGGNRVACRAGQPEGERGSPGGAQRAAAEMGYLSISRSGTRQAGGRARTTSQGSRLEAEQVDTEAGCTSQEGLDPPAGAADLRLKGRVMVSLAV